MEGPASTPTYKMPDRPGVNSINTQPALTWRVHVHVLIKALKVLRVQLMINARHIRRSACVQSSPVHALKEGVRLDLLQLSGVSGCECVDVCVHVRRRTRMQASPVNALIEWV
jgi:hypothetical protein